VLGYSVSGRKKGAKPLFNMNISDGLIELLKSQVIPALGCTEPVAVALASAKAREELGRIPDSVKISVSPNIYKNSLGVYIPGTGDMGIHLAAALGIVAGVSALKLQVLQNIEAKDISLAREMVINDRIKVVPIPDREGLYIMVEADDACEVVIEGKHDHIASVKVNGRVILRLARETESNLLELTNDFETQTIAELREIIETIDLKKIAFIAEGIEMNQQIAAEGMKNKHGLGLGPALEALVGQGVLAADIVNKTRMLTASAADARMSGVKMPVMTSGGSGNQGIAAILPVVIAAEHYGINNENLLRAVTFSHLLNIYIKKYTGKLSAVCGCAISAGAGAAAAVVWMLGGSDEQISGAVKNIIGNLFGMICDGAKASCSFKLSTASSEALLAAMLALNDIVISGRDGIIFPTAEETIINMGEICIKGMKAADQTILDIMMRKDYK
jgi:L-cysteine desulfidase